MNKEYKFRFAHYWNYFKTSYIISLKSLFEYKADLYSSIILTFFWNFSFILFGYLLAQDFLLLINWNLTDYFMFCLITYFIYNFNGMFIYNKTLETLIVKGDLSKFLYRPGNRSFNYLLNIEFNTFLVTVSNLVMFLPYILYNWNYTLIYLAYIFLIFILCLILQFVFTHFLNSSSLLILKMWPALISIVEPIERSLQSYTPIFLNKNWGKTIIFIFQSYFVANIIIPLFRGVLPESLIINFIVIVSLIIIFSFGIYLEWYFGLKKYEGYN